MDAVDRQILALLVEDGRRTYDDIAGRVSLSGPSVKRRVDLHRAAGLVLLDVDDHSAERLADPAGEHGGLDEIDDRALERRRAPPRGRHRVREARQPLAHPVGRWGAGDRGQARLPRVAVREPPQRCGHVRVLVGDGSVARLLGRRAVEGRVPRATHEPGRLAQDRGVRGGRRVEGAHEVRIGLRLGPRRAEGQGRASQAGDRPGVGRRHGAQDPGARPEHQVRRREAGEQGDLRVVALDRQRGAVGERPTLAVRRGVDLLLGHGEAHAAALALERLAQPADLGEQLERLCGAARVEPPLDLLVAELRPAAHGRPAQVGPRALAVGVEVDRPQQRRALAPRQERGGALAHHGRVEAGAPVGRVVGDAARPRVGVEGAARRDEGGDVGDRVVDAVAAARPALEVQGLVEVHRPLRVDRHERDVEGVVAGRVARRHPGLRQRGGPVGVGDAELLAQRVEGQHEVDEADREPGHRRETTGAGPSAAGQCSAPACSRTHAW